MKTTTIISIICISAIIFGSCRARTSTENLAETSDFAEIIEQNDAITKEEGVVINGVRWATRNVDAPGTFAPTPESLGKFFQWNRQKGWNTTDRYVEGWDNKSWEPVFEWEKENCPCPIGWRTPTLDELISLRNAGGRVWGTLNGVNGVFVGRAPNQIFIPAVGMRDEYDGTLRTEGNMGRFWGKEESAGINVGTAIWFDDTSFVVGGHWRLAGLSVRCVAFE